MTAKIATAMGALQETSWTDAHASAMTIGLVVAALRPIEGGRERRGTGEGLADPGERPSRCKETAEEMRAVSERFKGPVLRISNNH